MAGFRQSPQFGNEFEQRARERKAADIVTHARIQGITQEQLGAMNDAQRQTLLATAGHGHASDETWGMVHKSLGTLEKHESGDPFEGL
jgi:hypothetical protein